MLLRPISDQELAEDDDHPQLMQRLHDLREVSKWQFGVCEFVGVVRPPSPPQTTYYNLLV